MTVRFSTIEALTSKLAQLGHRPSSPAAVFRRCFQHERSPVYPSSSPSFKSSHYHSILYTVPVQPPRRSWQPSQRRILPAHSGARPFSCFGVADSSSPKSPRLSTIKPGVLRGNFYLRNTRNPSARPKKSSAASWSTAALVIGLLGSIVLYSGSLGDAARLRKQQNYTPDEFLDQLSPEKAIGLDKMLAETLPGRPGKLSTLEEERLREFWIASLKVFGVLEGRQATGLNGNGNVDAANGNLTSDTSVSVKPKKKRMGLFRSKHRDDDAESTTSRESSPHTPNGFADADDKYGQTKEFHEALASQSPESLRATFWSMVKHDHPDGLLLRFLRARKWDVEKALVMMVSTMRWRSKEMHVDDDIMKNGELASLVDANGSVPAKKELGEGFLAQLRLGKSFLHGLDKLGRPMCFVRVRLHKQGEQSEESLERYTVFLIESARMVLAPPVDTACIIFDMTGFSMANMDYAPVKFMIKCFEANYPESLAVVLVHKAPWVFQGIWKIIKGWLDPVVASKVHFTNNNEDMEEFVPRSQIIKELGGDEDWTYQYIEPVPGENDIMKDTETRDKLIAERDDIIKDYEKATLDWVHDADLSEIKNKRDEFADALKENYWRLDPYIRAKTYYDRTGMIKQGGKLQFYASKTETVSQTKALETSADDVE